MLPWKETIPPWSWMNPCVLCMAQTFRKWTTDLETDGNGWEQMEQKFSPAELGLLAEQIHITIKRDTVVRGEHLMGTSTEQIHLACFPCLFSSDRLKCSECIKPWLCILYVCPGFLNAPAELPRCAGDGRGQEQHLVLCAPWGGRPWPLTAAPDWTCVSPRAAGSWNSPGHVSPTAVNQTLGIAQTPLKIHPQCNNCTLGWHRAIKRELQWYKKD